MTTNLARVALVTGATGGMGLAICAELSDAGWTVARTDLPGTGVEFGGSAQARDRRRNHPLSSPGIRSP